MWKNVKINFSIQNYFSGNDIPQLPQQICPSQQINTKYRQGIFSTTLDDLHEKWNLPLPDYIKIDVDGIEHKIIEGSNKIFENKKLLSILIEINENRKEDKSIIKKLKKFNFNYDKEQVEKSKRKDGPHKGYAEYLFYR